MKFAKVLEDQSIPEWYKKYLDYRGAKKIIRGILPQELKASIEQQAFFNFLQAELYKIDEFYSTKETECSQRMDILEEQIETLQQFTMEAKHTTLEHESTAQSSDEDVNFTWNSFTAGIKTETLQKLTKIKELKVNFPTDTLQSLLGHRQRNSITGTLGDTPGVDWKVAHRKIQKATKEHYRTLELLKNYRSLNLTAFSKILKKFSKAAGWDGAVYFQPFLNATTIGRSAVITTLQSKTETIYIDAFEGGSRRRAMQKLRDPDLTAITHHQSSWMNGLVFGIAVSLLFYTATYLQPRIANGTTMADFKTLAQIYAGLGTFIMFVGLFGINVFIWSRNKINYAFIFEFGTKEYLHFHDFFQFAAILFFLWALAVFLTFSGTVPISPATTSLLHGVILAIILIHPFDFMHLHARRWLMRSLARIVTAPFSKVQFRDFFLTDELISLVYFLITMEVVICAHFHHFDDIDVQCNSSYSFATPVIQMLPYFWRLLQCCRRYHDTKQVFPHAYNAGKYTCSIVVLWISASSRASGSTGWQLAWVSFGLLSSCYSLYWDVVMDWSLYQFNEGWLQRDLLYPAKWYYIYALTTNAILRFLWLISVNPAAIGIDVPRKVLMFVLAVCEVYRRWQWNFLRMENEHLNNCVQFRATNEILLPFAARLKSSNVHDGVYSLDNSATIQYRAQDYSPARHQSILIGDDATAEHEEAKPIPVPARTRSLRSFSLNISTHPKDYVPLETIKSAVMPDDDTHSEKFAAASRKTSQSSAPRSTCEGPLSMPRSMAILFEVPEGQRPPSRKQEDEGVNT